MPSAFRLRSVRPLAVLAAAVAGFALLVAPGTASADPDPGLGDPNCLLEQHIPGSGLALSALPFDPAKTLTGTAVHAFGTGWDDQVWTRQIGGSGGGWQSLGGVSRYGPAAVFAGSTHHVLVVGGDGAIWMRSNAGVGWGGWISLGGYFYGSPAVASLGAGHLRVFGVGGDHGLWSNEYAGGRWSGWHSLGGDILSPPVATAYPGYVEASVMGADGLVWTVGLGQGARAGQWMNQYFAACSTLSVPSVSTRWFPDQRVFLDQNWSMRFYYPTLAEPAFVYLGGHFDGNPDIEHNNVGTNGVTIAGIGTDGAMWVYDPRFSPVWVSYGGRLY